MIRNNIQIPDEPQTSVESSVKPRRNYRKPKLEDLGDLRTLTLGGSPGVGDSGNPGSEFPPGVHASGYYFPPLGVIGPSNNFPPPGTKP
jgi:hypothetical protein